MLASARQIALRPKDEGLRSEEDGHRDFHRWQAPFGLTPIRPRALNGILSLPLFSEINPADFPDDLPFHEIISNDGRILRFDQDEMIYDDQEYENSVFVVLRGRVQSVTEFDADRSGHGSLSDAGNGWFKSGPGLNSLQKGFKSVAAGMFGKAAPRRGSLVVHQEDVDSSLPRQRVSVLGAGEMFGVSSALRRTPRGNCVYACDESTIVLELRWAGVRDLRFWSTSFRERMDGVYQVRNCIRGLRQCALFNKVDDLTLHEVARDSIFETFGEHGWSHQYQRFAANPSGNIDSETVEPTITEQGDHLQGLLVIASGFVRVSHKLDKEEMTVGFLTKGDEFGLERLIGGIESGGSLSTEFGLRACGYADVIWIPQQVIEDRLLPGFEDPFDISRHIPEGGTAVRGTDLPQPVLDFIIDNRFFNGTTAMIINTDRCVSCDDCVRACAATHNNVPRFLRQGKTHHNMMVANACMHCTDPLCLIDCPTSAIHREIDTGTVVIEEAMCIGCGTCASACPYDNIRMEKALDSNGAVFMGDDGSPRLKATKCDLCVGQNGGPACKRACPHDAISRVDMENMDMLSDWLHVAQE